MEKITYLFGAGASKNALPLVNEIPDKIKSMVERLSQEDLQLSKEISFEHSALSQHKSKGEFQADLVGDLNWLHEESGNHASIDTLAKKLYLKQDWRGLRRLKVATSVFFIIEQIWNKPDFRYDSFFASILSRKFSFPDNLRILSWNYDYQFELAYSEYSGAPGILENQINLNVVHKHSRFDLENKFGIHKLNGTTGLYAQGGRDQYMYTEDLRTSDVLEIGLVDTIVRNYAIAHSVQGIHTNFAFAWERDERDKSIVDSAILNTEDTVALVVIGYSFPFFNREIDRKIFGRMKNLKSVYFQAPDADVLMERFGAIRDDSENLKLIPKYDLGQFVLPNEF